MSNSTTIEELATHVSRLQSELETLSSGVSRLQQTLEELSIGAKPLSSLNVNGPAAVAGELAADSIKEGGRVLGDKYQAKGQAINAPSLTVTGDAEVTRTISAKLIKEDGKALSDKYQPKGVYLTKGDRIAKPLREQLVNRRIIWGLAGDPRKEITHQWTDIRFVYKPFDYAAGSSQRGAIRRYKFYAIYSDNVTKDDGVTESLEIGFLEENTRNVLPLGKLNRTWGGLGDDTRDAYSKLFEAPQKRGEQGHGTIRIKATVSGKRGVLRWLELQAWDIFE